MIPDGPPGTAEYVVVRAEASWLHLRVRGRMSPRWFAALYLATITPADYVMATGMLRGIKERAGAVTP